MQNDPLAEWQRLSEHYRKMYDDELLNLAADAADLTETAQQALRQEMRSRGLGEPQSARTAQKIPEPMIERRSALRSNLAGVPELFPDTQHDDEIDLPHEYTWKTLLCECATSEEARQLSEALRRAGIDSWIELPNAPSRYSDLGEILPYTGLDLTNPRVLVAADQLEEARAIATQPIPQEIVEAQEMTAPEFEPPVCPKCGAGDPVLEGVDPFNTWRCEACGNQWTESAEDLIPSPEKLEQPTVKNGKSRPATGQLSPQGE
jgi:ribosomal protein L37AE/L43A